MKILSIILILLFSVGCDKNGLGNDFNDWLYTDLDLYMDTQKDDNGYWLVQYNGYNYTEVKYYTEPNTWVEWGTHDYFQVTYQNRIFETPIIANSTYSGSDGNSKQLIYINETFKGDTLRIWGCVPDNCEYLSFIVY